MCRFLSGLIDVLAFNILPAWLAWIRRRLCGRSIYFRLALRAEGSVRCCPVRVCGVERGSELCGVRMDCVVRRGCMYCTGCATTWRVQRRRRAPRRRRAQLTAAPPFLWCVPATRPAARADRRCTGRRASRLRRLVGGRDDNEPLCSRTGRSRLASTCCTSSCGSASHLIPAVAVWLTAAGRAARHGVACGERLVRSEPVCRCGTGLRATHRHARTAHTILMVLVHEEVPLHLLSARLYRGHREGGAASHFLHSISCSTAGAPPGSKDQAACAAATESLRAASRGATVTAAASCRLEVPPTQHCAAALCRAARGQTGSAFEGLSSARSVYRVRAPHTIYDLPQIPLLTQELSKFYMLRLITREGARCVHSRN